MFQQAIILGFSGLVLLFIAATLFFIYLKSYLQEANEIWVRLLAGLRLRLDKIPNLIDTFRNFEKSGEKNISDLIKLRAIAWPMDKPNAQLVQKHLSISSDLNELYWLADKNDFLKKDINYLAIKMDIKKLGAKVENIMTEYNRKIEKYNKFIGIFGISLLAKLFKFHKRPLLEFEP